MKLENPKCAGCGSSYKDRGILCINFPDQTAVCLCPRCLLPYVRCSKLPFSGLGWLLLSLFLSDVKQKCCLSSSISSLVSPLTIYAPACLVQRGLLGHPPHCGYTGRWPVSLASDPLLSLSLVPSGFSDSQLFTRS